MESSEKWFETYTDLLKQIEVTDSNGVPLSVSEGFSRLIDRTNETQRLGKRIFFIGNGASASMASHIAADLCKNGRLKTEVFTDLALMTALVNDLGVERMFDVPLRQQATKGDALVAISSSGKSPNILRGARTAKSLGVHVITLTGMGPDNPVRSIGDLNFYLPAPTYGLAESAHAAILHYWVDWALEELGSYETVD